MASPAPTSAPLDALRKRSRSSSPSLDSNSPAASKKANTDLSGPVNLSTLEEGEKIDSVTASPAATTAEHTAGGASDETKMAVAEDGAPASATTDLPTPMVVDLELPSNPTAGQTSTADEAAAPAPIQMRALIVTQDASIIIGKGGKNVNEIRDKSGSKITITEAIPGSPERVMCVAGMLDAVSKAFGLVVRRINDEPFDTPSVPGSRAVTIRFIIPNARMGSVIGRAGSKIKEIQEASGARLQASEAMLPGSTERVLSVSGVADAIHIAVYYIGTILQEHSQASATSSSNNNSSNNSNTSYRPQSGGNQAYQPGGSGGDYGRRDDRDRGNGGERRSGGTGGGGGANAPGSQTQQIFIPNDLVGSIIGKAGAKINEIRQASQCQIKICEPGEGSPGANPAERLVTITGQQSGIQIAVGLLYTRLESEKQKQLNGGN